MLVSFADVLYAQNREPDIITVTTRAEMQAKKVISFYAIFIHSTRTSRWNDIARLRIREKQARSAPDVAFAKGGLTRASSHIECTASAPRCSWFSIASSIQKRTASSLTRSRLHERTRLRKPNVLLQASEWARRRSSWLFE